LHSAIDRELPDLLEIIELLCRAGADVNAYGINGWTPLHMAAAWNNVEAIKILLRHGADLQARTEVDDYYTPLEEAMSMGSIDAARFLWEREVQAGKITLPAPPQLGPASSPWSSSDWTRHSTDWP
jgi:ankyrin repeat protein